MIDSTTIGVIATGVIGILGPFLLNEANRHRERDKLKAAEEREKRAHEAEEEREKRARQYLIEDRKLVIAEIVEKAKAEAEALRITTEATTAATAAALLLEQQRIAAVLREDTRKTADFLEAKIDSTQAQAKETHTAAISAFNEANHTKAEMAAMRAEISAANKRILEQGLIKRDTTEKLDQIQTTAENIETKVDTIADSAKP